jgi:anti-sigma-K factor RskA
MAKYDIVGACDPVSAGRIKRPAAGPSAKRPSDARKSRQTYARCVPGNRSTQTGLWNRVGLWAYRRQRSRGVALTVVTWSGKGRADIAEAAK